MYCVIKSFSALQKKEQEKSLLSIRSAGFLEGR
jgi:hypothetical protein